VHGGTVYKEVVNEGDLNLFDTISSFLISDGRYKGVQINFQNSLYNAVPKQFTNQMTK
jgi:hypothetical protein